MHTRPQRLTPRFIDGAKARRCPFVGKHARGRAHYPMYSLCDTIVGDESVDIAASVLHDQGRINQCGHHESGEGIWQKIPTDDNVRVPSLRREKASVDKSLDLEVV